MQETNVSIVINYGGNFQLHDLRIVMGKNHRIIRMWLASGEVEYLMKDPVMNRINDVCIYRFKDGKIVKQ